MTEWNAGGYYRQSALQKWVADEHLASLALDDGERVLDVGCGDGKIAEAERDRFIVDAYAQVGDDAGPSVFVFYQMEVELRRPLIGQDHRAC
jgi:trans-aconitate methyltransferase